MGRYSRLSGLQAGGAQNRAREKESKRKREQEKKSRFDHTIIKKRENGSEEKKKYKYFSLFDFIYDLKIKIKKG